MAAAGLGGGIEGGQSQVARTPFRRTNTCRSSKPIVSFPSSPCLCRWDAGWMPVGCNHPFHQKKKKNNWKAPEAFLSVREGRLRRAGPVAGGGSGHCASRCAGRCGRSMRCPQRQVQPLFRRSPFSRPRLPLRARARIVPAGN